MLDVDRWPILDVTGRSISGSILRVMLLSENVVFSSVPGCHVEDIMCSKVLAGGDLVSPVLYAFGPNEVGHWPVLGRTVVLHLLMVLASSASDLFLV